MASRMNLITGTCGDRQAGDPSRVRRPGRYQRRRRIRHWYYFLGVLFIYGISMTFPYAWAQSGPPSEYEIKAAFLYNFAKFIEWPTDQFVAPGSPIVIGVVGQDPFDGVLDQTVKDKTINGRSLLIKRSNAVQDLKSCHILFVSPSEKKRLPQIMSGLAQASVLTVSETEQFLQEGGIINFVIENNRVRFDINKGMADRARIRISSKLLGLAKSVVN